MRPTWRDPEEMFNSLKKLQSNLSKETIIMPGHNYSIQRQSTLKEEIEGNPFFSFNNLDAFVQYRMHDHDKQEMSLALPSFLAR